MAHLHTGSRGEAEITCREEDDDEDDDRDYDDATGSAPQLPGSSERDQQLASSAKLHAQMLVNAMLAAWRNTNEAGAACICLALTRPCLLLVRRSSLQRICCLNRWAAVADERMGACCLCLLHQSSACAGKVPAVVELVSALVSAFPPAASEGTPLQAPHTAGNWSQRSSSITQPQSRSVSLSSTPSVSLSLLWHAKGTCTVTFCVDHRGWPYVASGQTQRPDQRSPPQSAIRILAARNWPSLALVPLWAPNLRPDCALPPRVLKACPWARSTSPFLALSPCKRHRSSCINSSRSSCINSSRPRTQLAGAAATRLKPPTRGECHHDWHLHVD
jgi:hypothetical protein